MLFNSYEFIFLLLPIALIGNRILSENYSARIVWLLSCSLFFYAWWNPVYLPLLLSTIAFNYFVGAHLRAKPTKLVLVAGVATNLALIGYFKYAGFIADNIASLTGSETHFGDIALPLAISFFTFQQIAYLADCYSGLPQRYRPTEYGLFVSFFPQLIAGPIVHHAEMMPQIKSIRRSTAVDKSVGLTIFALGLFKKAVLADGIAPYANGLFDDPQACQSATLVHAWIGVLAYGFQIYFDFSGYSDMAIGAARMFGIKLPLNFFAPYRSESISEFWRRWHMTLSRFLRDYLYIPLGGNRRGNARRYRNLMITMLLGGLWHGAGWTFVLWGALHGGYLVIQHGWSHQTKQLSRVKQTWVYRLFACATTFIAVQFAWVYFRATSLETANQIVGGMIGSNGISLPHALLNRLGGISRQLAIFGINGDSASGTNFVMALGWIGGLSLIVWLLPTTQSFMRRFQPAWEYTSQSTISRLPDAGFGPVIPLTWTPSLAWSLLISLVALVGILSLAEVSEFLYFQF
ncbi:MBOAT family protein [Stieleria sp. ICT_E10.1]|uniref:MBOAT family O-acyltransferase n=1 Tax=Stieleria sedimenti TaxID=2976331 RepID=UPI002180659E|nr:MBOAT family protein [Stieleria sedimenti]MCS7466761.1 MBOAT family protein [Stieleria sedimenti]